MSPTKPSVGSYDFFYQPSEEALKEAVNAIMQYAEEHRYFEHDA